jgi:hypothetical protein
MDYALTKKVVRKLWVVSSMLVNLKFTGFAELVRTTSQEIHKNNMTLRTSFYLPIRDTLVTGCETSLFEKHNVAHHHHLI